MKNGDLGIPEWPVELQTVSPGCRARAGVVSDRSPATDIAHNSYCSVLIGDSHKNPRIPQKP